MLNLIRGINLQVAGYLAVTISSIVIVLHGLVILKVIPYNIINGGRSVSYEAQKQQSIVGMVILFGLVVFFLVASNIVGIDFGSMGDKVVNIILWILAILLVINTVMQLLGTKFERYCMSTCLVVLLICVIRMIIE